MKRLIFLYITLFLSACGHREKESNPNVNIDTNVKSDLEADDNTNIQFDPDGYYYPTDTLRYKQFEMGRRALDIFIMESPSKGNFIRRPKDSVFIALNFRDTLANEDMSLKTADFLITKDTLVLNFHSDKIGDIKVVGHFTGNKGPYYDNVEVFKTIVLKTKLIFKDATFSTDFTYWEGD
jgi:hypothetical protein